jgi:perosamine synthetase
MQFAPDDQTTVKRGRVPIAPVLNLASLGCKRDGNVPTLLEADSALLTTSGRTALALALQALAVGPGDEILVPAYHCPAIVAPIEACGARPVFYKSLPNLAADSVDVRRLISARTRAAVFVHFFGLLQDLSALRQICDQNGLAMVEDCAHAFYGSRGGVPVGSTGDFAIGSLMKFFPGFDGGCLVSYRRDLHGIKLRSPGLYFELKAALNVAERALQFRPSLAGVSRGLAGARNLIAGAFATARGDHQRAPRATEGGFESDAAWVGVRASASSRLIRRATNGARAVTRRRKLYAAYLRAIGTSPAGAAFEPDIGQTVVPYVFPYLLNRPAQHFEALWEAGVPLYRWEHVTPGVCPVTDDYRDRLIQFPCHETLLDSQVDWLLETAGRVLGRRAGGSLT